jgi:hypothetical protein
MTLAAGRPEAASTPGHRRTNRDQLRIGRLYWLALAVIAGQIYAVQTSWSALMNRYVVADDVRQHIFWIPRLHNPALFRNDLIADYYAAQATPGFAAIYWLGTLVVDTITLTKLLLSS